MPRGLRDLRRKMKAIRSTRQVTKAMELVAASKMRRATQSAVQLRRYALTAWQILETLAEANPGLHPFLTERPPQRILGILFSPDRGLCGSLSAQMFRMVMQYIAKLQAISAPPELSFVAVGKKGQQFLLRNRQTIIAAFPAFSAHPQFRDILPIVRLATDSFLGGQCDSVVLLYPDFISALRRRHPPPNPPTTHGSADLPSAPGSRRLRTFRADGRHAQRHGERFGSPR